MIDTASDQRFFIDKFLPEIRVFRACVAKKHMQLAVAIFRTQ
jgi:hypothetical protein